MQLERQTLPALHSLKQTPAIPADHALSHAFPHSNPGLGYGVSAPGRPTKNALSTRIEPEPEPKGAGAGKSKSKPAKGSDALQKQLSTTPSHVAVHSLRRTMCTVISPYNKPPQEPSRRATPWYMKAAFRFGGTRGDGPQCAHENFSSATATPVPPSQTAGELSSATGNAPARPHHCVAGHDWQNAMIRSLKTAIPWLWDRRMGPLNGPMPSPSLPPPNPPVLPWLALKYKLHIPRNTR